MPRNILTHELNRVRTMKDKQLLARYNKMTKVDKIEMFYKALKKENRYSHLRNVIAKDLGWDKSPTYKKAMEWFLEHPTFGSYVFTPIDKEDGSTQIRVTECMAGSREACDLDDRDDELSIDDARDEWDRLIDIGYIFTTEV